MSSNSERNGQVIFIYLVSVLTVRVLNINITSLMNLVRLKLAEFFLLKI